VLALLHRARWAVLLLGAAACGQGSRGAARTGESCGVDRDCAHGLCVAGVSGPHARCTISCASQTDCPQGWSCTGVTQRNVLVCQRGDPTPLGSGGH
jgi:hypothetical protein